MEDRVTLTGVQRELAAAARAAAAAAYAPYSGFKVGAAALGASGRVHLGCNVENASYPVTVCAERAAVAAAVAAGEARIAAVAVAGDDASATVAPCGLCRQFLAEFGSGLAVVFKLHGSWVARPIGDLLPDAFSLDGGAGTGGGSSDGLPAVGRPAAGAGSGPGHGEPAVSAGRGSGRLTLRRVLRADMAELRELAEREREVFGHTGLRREDLAVVGRAGAVLVGRSEGRMIGSCQLVRVYDDPDAAWVVGFYVLPAERGVGFGRELLQAVAAEAGAAGISRLVLTVAADNRSALELYRSFGFRLQEVIPDFYGPGEDRLLLSCSLAGGDTAGRDGTGERGHGGA